MKKIILTALFLLAIISLPKPIFAATPRPGPSGGPCGSDTKIYTAIGCIPYTDMGAFMGFFLRWGIGIGGGIAFILIAIASFQIITSSGDPQRLKAGQELLTSAIAGLIMLIFSIFILRLIGVNILGVIL